MREGRRYGAAGSKWGEGGKGRKGSAKGEECEEGFVPWRSPSWGSDKKIGKFEKEIGATHHAANLSALPKQRDAIEKEI